MASVAVVTLPNGVSVVLISIICLKIARASARSSADAVGSELWANREEQRQETQSHALVINTERAAVEIEGVMDISAHEGIVRRLGPIPLSVE